MDSNRLSSEPYFNPQQPGTVCIAMDRYGHYRPSSENALRFLQQDDVETGVRHFLDDNVKAATLCTYVPDVTLLVFRFQSMKDVPPPGSGQTADRYIRDTLLPFLASESRLPEKKIPLADAVYSTLTRGTPDCSVLKKHFMQETGYIEFLGRQRERKNIYRLQPEYVLPLTVVKNDFGYLLFSGNETGREGFRACIQHVADHYFDPHCDMGRLDIYECPVLKGKLPSFIDTVYAPFRYFPVNRFDFSPHRHVAPSALPEGFTEGLVPLYSHPLRPDADSFAGFISRFKDDERTQTTVSRENYDIYRLLTVMRNGYMNVHEKPFTYFDTLLPVARKLEQVTQVKNAAAFNADDFRIYSSVLSRQAEAILQRDFDVRGHRSIVNELDDGNLAFTVGRVKLNSVQRAVLHDGHAVHLPENDSPENRRQAYCMADRFENRLVTSARPFPGVRIVGDDPESPESYPYKGTVTALCETGRNETDFYIVIKLDGESMRQPEISRCCPEGIMRCFPWTVSPEEKRNNIPSTAYTAVETSRGFLFFTHTEEGRRSLREFLQEMADTYFEPSFDLGPVCVYEAEGVLTDLSPVNPEKISLAAYPYARKPEDFRLDVRYRNGMRPTAEDFRSFCHNAGCTVSHRNGNIADTLETPERYDRHLETLRHMPETAPHEEDETCKTRQQLQRLPDSAYDVRGHRTAGRIPDDPAHAYAWVDRNTDRIVFGSRPPGDRETAGFKRDTGKRSSASPRSTKKKTGPRHKM